MSGYPFPAPRTEPIKVRQGESLDRIGVLLRNPDGTPYDLIGWTSHATARLASDSATTLFDLTDTNNGIVIDTAIGRIGLKGNGALTAAFAFGVYQFDWFARDASGLSFPLWDSIFVVIATETRYP